MSEERTKGQDMRVRRTRKHLKEAFLRMILKKPLEKIKVTDLAEIAEINRKTFYLHFTDIYDLMDTIADETAGKIIRHFSDELTQNITVIYETLDTDDASYQLLFFDASYGRFQKRFWRDIFSSDFFRKYYGGTEHPEITCGYLFAIPSIYRAWRDSKEKTLSLSELAETASDLIERGFWGGGIRILASRSESGVRVA